MIQLDCENTIWILPGPIGGGRSCSIAGEAIPVDLGARGLLFVTLHGRLVGPPSTLRIDTNPIYLMGLARAFPDAGKDAQGHLKFLPMLRDLKREQPKADLPLMYLPMLVRFRDISDPKSVEEVDPDHVDASFGPGAQIVSASIAVTDDPVTRGIEKLLPWVDAMGGATLDGDLSVARSPNAPLSNHLGTGDFQIRN